MNFNLEIPINGMSFGQMGFGILHEMFNRRLLPNIFPIHQVNLSAFNVTQSFCDWLKFCINKSKAYYSRDYTTIRLWHIFDSVHRLSDKQVLWTAHETDSFTLSEKNILKQQDAVLFTSNFAREIAVKNDIPNVDVCPNYFDSIHFGKKPNHSNEDFISFSLIGKLEKRKNTIKIIQMWSKLFGNNSKFRLNCLIANPFLSEDQWNNLLSKSFPMGLPWNVNLIPRQEKNEMVSQIMHLSDIDLSGLSSAEGFNLPCFNMLALDKISVVLNAHAHKDFVDDTNAVLVQPNGKEPIYDGFFFKEGDIANQGNMFSFSEEEAENAILQAVEKHKQNSIIKTNLKEKFSVTNTVDKLLSYI